MILIDHRVNSIERLQKVPKSHGVELDIRYHEDELILHHDPFSHHKVECERFEDFLEHWNHQGPMILNVKTEGVEKKCIEIMAAKSIQNWFFLDLSMPYFVKYALLAEKKEIPAFSANNLAVRFSEHEPVEYALAFAKKAGWVWVDCFSRLPLDEGNYRKLKGQDFKICLVSPELQGHSAERIKNFREICKNWEIDAVCTKFPAMWS